MPLGDIADSTTLKHTSNLESKSMGREVSSTVSLLHSEIFPWLDGYTAMGCLWFGRSDSGNAGERNEDHATDG